MSVDLGVHCVVLWSGMLGKEDGSGGCEESGGGGGPREPSQVPNSGNRKTYWRSASWSSSRMSLPPLNPDGGKDCLAPNGNNGGFNRKFQVPLTPRSHSKARSCLPPLQPLAIARRSLDEWPKAGSDDVGEWPLPSTPSGRDLNNGGERLKLDLSSIQRIPEKNAGLVKREKIAFFDKECSKVADHIYLGGDAVAKDRDILKQHGITHILNCVGFVCPEYFQADFVYRTLWLQDSPSEDITSILYDVFDYFEDVREQCGKVFVHCCQGVSRSTSLVIAYRMWREGQSFDDAFQYVKAARGIADPNMGFACQLLQCQKRVHAFPLSPSSLLRLYRIAPHSPYDPLHLVPKILNAPSPAALDSRGAFIVHIPSAIYVWIGKKCESIMERDARGAVCQIARYEKVQGPIVVVQEGGEPSYFWDSFSNLLPLMDRSSNGVDVVESAIKILPGNRKVDSYNVDFEIFNKAIVGGFVPPFTSSEAEHETHLPVRESSWTVLRRKFAVGSMKEFVLASKSAPSRVYPDSALVVGKPHLFPANSLSSSLFSSSSSSSSSSPPYLSPDSLSSDSSISSKCFSDSPAVSPSVASCSHAFSSTLSTFSNLSILPTKLSPHSISKSSEFIDVNFTSKSSLSVLSPHKKSSLSIAERRGSRAKCLRLPMLIDDSQGKEAIYPACEEDGVRINDDSCSETELSKDSSLDKDIILQLKRNGSVQEPTSQGSSCRVRFDNSHGDSALDKISDERESYPSKREESADFSEMVGSDTACPNIKQSVVVCQWPSLEKVLQFGASDLDSTRVFIFITPCSGLGKIVDTILYIWIGKFFSHDNKIRPGTSKGLDELQDINWKTVSSDVLSQIGLPEDTDIKIVKEDEEPLEFLTLLGSL